MQADKTVCSFHCSLVLIGVVVGVNDFQLRLFGVFAEGVA